VATSSPDSPAASSAGVPCSSVAQMNRTSSPICRRYRAWMSAGRSEPARFPRCLIPLMYGSALVMSTFAIGSSWGSLVVARQTWRNEKALRRTGRAWVRRHTRGESARSNPPANFLLIGPAHSRGMVGGEHSQTPGGSASSICLIGPSKTRGRRGSKDRWNERCRESEKASLGSVSYLSGHQTFEPSFLRQRG
jgi:hypothetical protein